MSIRAVIFDLGGVLVRTEDPARAGSWQPAWAHPGADLLPRL